MNSKTVQAMPPAVAQAPLQLLPYRTMRTGFVLAIALQFALLAGTVAPHVYTLLTGRTVTLRTVPVDPWDPFRGTYVTLQYDFSRIPNSQSFKTGDEVYVVLKKQGETWMFDSAHHKRPEVSGDLVLKGKVGWTNFGSDMHVDYGIERIYQQEGTGAKLEAAKHLLVDVAVDSNGNAVVKRAALER